LWSDQGRLEVVAIIVLAGNDTREIMHGDLPKETTIPINDDDDNLLDSFVETHGLEDDDISWGDYFALPESLYRMEMIRGAHTVAENAKAQGITFAPNAKIGIRMEDEDYADPEVFARKARQKLAELEPGVARALLALYYADPDATGLLEAE
jgi:hypothetical protein